MHEHDAKVINILKISMYFIVQDLKVLVLSEVLVSTGITYIYIYIYSHTHIPRGVHLGKLVNMVR